MNRSNYNPDGHVRHLVDSGSGDCLSPSQLKPPGRELCATDRQAAASVYRLLEVAVQRLSRQRGSDTCVKLFQTQAECIIK